MSEYRKYCLADDTNSEEAKKLRTLIEQDDWKSYFKRQDEERKKELSYQDIKPYEYDQIKLDLYISELRYKYNVKPNLGSEWKNDLIIKYSGLKSDLLGYKYFPYSKEYKLTQEQKKEKENEAKMYLYRIKNNLKDNDQISYAGYLSLYTVASKVLLVFIVFLFAYIFYLEYKNNTIKQLMISRYSRTKIFISKLLSICAAAFIFVLLQLLISLIVGSLFYSGNLHPKLIVVNDSVVSLNYIAYLFIKYFLIYINILCYAFFALMITIIVKSAIFGISIALCMTFLINPLLEYLSKNYSFTFVKYLPSISFDLMQFLDGKVFIPGTNFISAIIIIIAWLVGCLFISNYFFNKDEA